MAKFKIGSRVKLEVGDDAGSFEYGNIVDFELTYLPDKPIGAFGEYRGMAIQIEFDGGECAWSAFDKSISLVEASVKTYTITPKVYPSVPVIEGRE